MISVFDMVLEFHKVYGVPVDVEMTEELVNLRQKLISEEDDEVYQELHPDEDVFETGFTRPTFYDKAKLTKELADLMYVVIGTAVTFGLPLEEVFAEVHKSNMSKLGEDGKPIYREDGKVMKGPNYKEPDLGRFF